MTAATHAFAQQIDRLVGMGGLGEAGGGGEVRDHLVRARPEAALRRAAEAALVEGIEQEAAARQALPGASKARL